jgi:hypothetical protein
MDQCGSAEKQEAVRDPKATAGSGIDPGGPVMGMPWRQRRLFTCTGCGMELLHDRMYTHSLFQCDARPAARLKMWLESGKRYEPVMEKDR